MRATLFTIGYQQRSLEDFVAIARKAGVDVIIDVRETAWSRKPGFSKSAFATALAKAGIDYIHASFAGNPKWLRENAANHVECLTWYEWYLGEFTEVMETFDALISEVLCSGQRVALTCFERHAEDCHRSILAERWANRARARDVRHLATDGCPRLITTSD
jgi:uncharacterized protein (DUF488 family)